MGVDPSINAQNVTFKLWIMIIIITPSRMAPLFELEHERELGPSLYPGSTVYYFKFTTVSE